MFLIKAASESSLLELLRIYLLEGHPGVLLWAPVPNHLRLANGMDADCALDAAPSWQGSWVSQCLHDCCHAWGSVALQLVQVPKSHLAKETWALWWHPFPCSELGPWGVLQVWPKWEAGRWEMAKAPHGVPILLNCAGIALGEGSAEMAAGQPPNAAQIVPEPPRSLHIWL